MQALFDSQKSDIRSLNMSGPPEASVQSVHCTRTARLGGGKLSDFYLVLFKSLS
ncbi:hypothetical protein KGM_203328 [Danaus plexippus plexippus]|uniref:Uncharacterized protein n=1 Tax=Danaus plexippus plexippus TaxID=278856 RepID=A0A212EQN8_DANPL|nr:hypothetical protein KGM_203328 [Danaus plexippus plexippus]